MNVISVKLNIAACKIQVREQHKYK
jgi:hypothetical protein